MSDQFYRERAARRARRIWIAAGAALIGVCAMLGVISLIYDACTGSFDRSPEAVLRRYARAVSAGEAATAQACWEKDAYFDLEAGCSEICLQNVAGNRFEVANLEVSAASDEPEGRARLQAELTAACQATGETHTAEIILDTPARNYPWRHWRIVRSSLGGTVAEPWCE
jgi:hypothetical protein